MPTVDKPKPTRNKSKSTLHVLKPVTAAPPAKKRKQEYVDVSSSSEHEGDPQPPRPASPKPAPAKATTRSGQKNASPPPLTKPPRTRASPRRVVSLPVQIAASPAASPSALTPELTRTKPQIQLAPALKEARPRRRRLEAYPHVVRISRDQVEQEWVLLSTSTRAHMRADVEQLARETLETVPRKTGRDAKMRAHLEPMFARFTNEFDALMATLPVPPLPPGLPPALLDIDTESSATSKKKGESRAKVLEPPGHLDFGGAADWSIEALEAHLSALEKRAEEAEAAAAARQEEEGKERQQQAVTSSSLVKTKKKGVKAPQRNERETEEEVEVPARREKMSSKKQTGFRNKASR